MTLSKYGARHMDAEIRVMRDSEEKRIATLGERKEGEREESRARARGARAERCACTDLRDDFLAVVHDEDASHVELDGVALLLGLEHVERRALRHVQNG